MDKVYDCGTFGIVYAQPSSLLSLLPAHRWKCGFLLQQQEGANTEPLCMTSPLGG